MGFFFFKQKTAYEMRISDWSSDVCSSDLQQHAVERARALDQAFAAGRRDHQFDQLVDDGVLDAGVVAAGSFVGCRAAPILALLVSRSEEPTSELQSLMRISYAVFCLKKKKQYKHHQTTTTDHITQTT